VPLSIAKTILDYIKKGELQLVKEESERLGNGQAKLVLPYLHDDKYHHNAIFYSTLIKDEQACLTMVEYLVQNGVDAGSVDSLNQTALFYASREGKLSLVDALVRLGCSVGHQDSNS
jgi:ankyrin repeat protein